MKIFHVFYIYDSFDHGSSEELRGTYESRELAEDSAKKLASSHYSDMTYAGDGLWKCVGYDQDSQYIQVHEAELNKEV